MTGVHGRPQLSPEQLPPLLERFGVSAEGRDYQPLDSYEDRNYAVGPVGGAREYVLKVHNWALPSGDRCRLEMQNRIICRLAEHGMPVPKVTCTPDGDAAVEVESHEPGAGTSLARLLTYVEGDIVSNSTFKNEVFLQGVGELVGHVARALDGFDDPAAHYTWDWDMKRLPEVVRSKLAHIPTPDRSALAERLVHEYEEVLSQEVMDALPHSVLHADLNDSNLLFRDGDVVGIIDFGDTIYSCTVFEPAIAAGYYCLGQPDPVMVMVEVLRGYTRTAPYPLSEAELNAYYQVARGRVLLSVAFASEYSAIEPDNEYLSHTADPGWRVLETLGGLQAGAVIAALREAVADASSA